MCNKIISFSVWGNDPRYHVGLQRQIELARKYYPDWGIRVYMDFLTHERMYKSYENPYVSIKVVMDGSYGMFWRFLPMFEDRDNITMVRDSDGRITLREAQAINEWLESDKTFHTFRDHEAHYEFPIIGCAFSFKGVFSTKLLEVMNHYMHNHKQYLWDQFYLRDHIWPVVKDNAMVHSMYEGWFGETRKKLVNKFAFCGNGWDASDYPLYPDSLHYKGNFDVDRLKLESKFDEGIMYE